MTMNLDRFDGFVGHFSLGKPQTVTIASGVATIPSGSRSYVRMKSESGTSDQLDTITKADAQTGDLLFVEAFTGHTITVDDANIDLGAATRVLADVGMMLTLFYNGAGWSELACALGDNS